jgi:dipeptidyl aminopeptidase/acylaminoacyl peptidase
VAVVTAGTADTNILEIIDLSTGKRRLLANARRQSPAAFFGVVAWSPNGALLAVTRSANAYGAGIEVLDARAGTLSRQFRVAARHDSRLSWAPDGQSLLFAQQGTPRTRATIRRLVLATGKVITVSPTAGFDPAVSRGGVVAFAASNGVRIRSGHRDVLLHASRPGDRAPTWSSDGEQLLVERPARGCPRSFTGDICTQVLVMSAGGGSARRLLEVPARSPVRR